MSGQANLALALALIAYLAPACNPAADAPAARRQSLLNLADKGAAALSALTRGLEDDNGVVRRTAARMLAKLGKPALSALGEALSNSDFVVRLVALRALTKALGEQALPHLAKAAQDDSPVIRQIAVAELVDLRPRTAEIDRLIERASKDEADSVRQIAAKVLWPFHKEVASIRDRKDWDHDIQTAQTIPLPSDGWRLKLDPGRDAHLKKWYEPNFDDST